MSRLRSEWQSRVDDWLKPTGSFVVDADIIPEGIQSALERRGYVFELSGTGDDAIYSVTKGEKPFYQPEVQSDG